MAGNEVKSGQRETAAAERERDVPLEPLAALQGLQACKYSPSALGLENLFKFHVSI